MKATTLWLCGAMVMWMAGFAGAVPIYDDLSTTANLTGWATSGTPDTAVSDGSDVTMTRVQANIDAGVDWYNSGTYVALTPEHNRLEIMPVGTTTGGYYSVALLFFNNGSYVQEVGVVSDSNSTAPLIVPDVASYATSPADAYFVRFRIQPYDQAGASFVFTQINAVPEPASMALLAIGGLAMLKRR